MFVCPFVPWWKGLTIYYVQLACSQVMQLTFTYYRKQGWRGGSLGPRRSGNETRVELVTLVPVSYFLKNGLLSLHSMLEC